MYGIMSLVHLSFLEIAIIIALSWDVKRMAAGIMCGCWRLSDEITFMEVSVDIYGSFQPPQNILKGSLDRHSCGGDMTTLAIACVDEARLKTNGIAGRLFTKLSQGLLVSERA